MPRTAYVEIDDEPRVRCFIPSNLAIHESDQCIVEVDNVLEFGLVAGFEDAGGDFSAERKLPKIIRRATLQDQAKANENKLMSKMAMDTCSTKIEKYDLEMRLIRVRYSFDRSVLRVLFSAEKRVDFRETVKELAVELHTRIEMKQIGVRDEAGVTGGLGPCGRRLCCCTWLHNFESINVKMAKTQRLSLNPGAISGMCSRLKCCLRYEYENYNELNKRLPRDGAAVHCPEGNGYVIDKNILAQRLKICLDDERVLEYSADEVETVWAGKKRPFHYREATPQPTESGG